ncbi:hypothetical protein G4Y79_22870 [Phototrophicus methaneseepsis]|uniref:Uncharacterized protein n=1 Tax=Phototrophicus methaneseepsis TaxID=2710758 RepID=A0A7S8E8T7_9CHLR|nr:hypothetical protein [Phototrophicus methaneseepsis]QPC82494.1 hypothetical protein G4Y79_22870 [Phototrophicus methaneseepsis]
MQVKTVNQNTPETLSENQHFYSADYYNESVLPKGSWQVKVLMGHAWVFCNGRNVPLHRGQTMAINEEDGDVRIRALYTRGYAAYTAQSEN